MIVRLNRLFSMCGIASRRKADELVRGGRVSVNGKITNELGYMVNTDSDIVKIGDRILAVENKRYILLNKPELYITALGKGQGNKKTIEELISEIPERIFPVGRLDYDTEGLLILTNDGELANRVLHPSYELIKVYLVVVEGRVSVDTVLKMRLGIELRDGSARPDWVEILKYEDNQSNMKIAFHEGRKHIVKRFLSKFGHPVISLKRVSIGPIKLVNLQKGRWRDLTEKEIIALKGAVNLK